MPKKPHPLTDDLAERIAPNAQWSSDAGGVVFTYNDMRVAYDKGDEDRLKQVIEWLEDYEQVCGGFIRIAYFKQAMRPQPQQQQQEDNNAG